MEKLVKFILRIYFGIFYKVELINTENIPRDGAALFCSNHSGTLDMFFVAYKVKRLVHYMAKQELFKNPIVAYVLRKVGAFPVKRGTGDVSSIKSVFKLLDEGKIVGIFPEGTRNKGITDKNYKVKPGTAMIAVKKDVPIVPVAVKGPEKLFGEVKVIFGEPFKLDADPDKKYSNSEFTEMSRLIMNRVYSLMEEY